MTTEPKKRRVRRDYKKELEKLEFYLETIIRVKDPLEAAIRAEPDIQRSEFLKGELNAYRDIQNYVRARGK